MALAINRAIELAEGNTMTVMEALAGVIAKAKVFAPLIPEVVQAVDGVATDLSQHKSAMTSLMDAVMLAEQIAKDATGI